MESVSAKHCETEQQQISKALEVSGFAKRAWDFAEHCKHSSLDASAGLGAQSFLLSCTVVHRQRFRLQDRVFVALIQHGDDRRCLAMLVVCVSAIV